MCAPPPRSGSKHVAAKAPLAARAASGATLAKRIETRSPTRLSLYTLSITITGDTATLTIDDGAPFDLPAFGGVVIQGTTADAEYSFGVLQSDENAIAGSVTRIDNLCESEFVLTGARL